MFGALVGSGTDSVQLTATLFDAGARTPVGEIKLRSSTTRMDGLVDSLAVHLLGELARVRPVVAVRRASLGSISLPALKAFLEGERFYRQANTDSALAYYQRSVELDSSFCLGWRRLGQVTEWSTFSGDSLARVYLLRAGRLNHGLPPRESLLVASESLFEALYEMQEPFWFEYRNRLFTTLEAAARLFPNDPEVWYELGEAREHWPLGGRNVSEHALEGFSRAIALDSSFTPGYFHTAELGLWQGGPAEARHYLAAYLAHAAPLVSARGDPWASGMALTYKLLDSDATPAQREFWISSASDAALFGALNALPASRDSAETEVRVARAFAGHHPTGNDSWERSRRLWLAFSLARRGHLREAYAAGGADPEVVWRLAPYSLRLRGPAADSTAAFFGRLLRARARLSLSAYLAAGSCALVLSRTEHSTQRPAGGPFGGIRLRCGRSRGAWTKHSRPPRKSQPFTTTLCMALRQRTRIWPWHAETRRKRFGHSWRCRTACAGGRNAPSIDSPLVNCWPAQANGEKQRLYLSAPFRRHSTGDGWKDCGGLSGRVSGSASAGATTRLANTATW